MFVLFTVEDTFLLNPDELANVYAVTEEKCRARYLNKVIDEEGLCVLVQQPVIQDKIVLQSEGTVQV